ncbi:uncharacterized protein SCHCODRAFT_01335046 [Schizophyllum commune H4-8]|uniref:Expressed protein n=1 Tax=Schizophyllum commune (strain H4-8 / FGSC 9210) TaxID=578458 RepID=D8PNJ1_SCHCM|nr:uncharacterized protein SCHCODRAFT_01335046 [Schizophyllum commune H4-8]KAI5893237.1 hypothetical protein SCHCODRAFT_01335046 [Schizophyllum commune H4-8]
MGAIMRSLPAAAHVEVLDIRESFNKEMSQLTCAHLLDLLPALTTIVLEMADYTLEFIDALHAAFLRWLERPDGLGPQPLRRIHYFASRYPRAEGITTVLLEDAVAARLSKLLRLYTSAGVYLEELRIEDVAERLPWGSLRVEPFIRTLRVGSCAAIESRATRGGRSNRHERRVHLSRLDLRRWSRDVDELVSQVSRTSSAMEFTAHMRTCSVK